MTDIVRIGDEYYISAKSSLADDRTNVLKHGESFAVFDRTGDINPVGLGEQGVFHAGTRHLSRLLLQLGNHPLLLLSSTVRENNARLTVDLTNQDNHYSGMNVTRREGDFEVLVVK